MHEQVARKLDVKQICFIDDSKTSAYVTKKLLKQQGYTADHFVNAESALEALMEHDYALLITDLMISSEGGVNGDDLIRLIRQSGHPVKSRIPIVVVTGSNDLATRDNLLHVGADRVLPKPLDAQILQSTIEELAPKLNSSELESSVAELRAAPTAKKESSQSEKISKSARLEIALNEQLKNLEEITIPKKIESSLGKVPVQRDLPNLGVNPPKLKTATTEQLKNLEEITSPEMISLKSEKTQVKPSDNIASRKDAHTHLSAEEFMLSPSIEKHKSEIDKTVAVQSKNQQIIAPKPEHEELSEIPTLTENFENEVPPPKVKAELTPAEQLLEAARTEETISALLEAMSEGKDEIERPVTFKKPEPIQPQPIVSKPVEKEKNAPVVKPDEIQIQPEIVHRQTSQPVEKVAPVKSKVTADKSVAQNKVDTEKDNPLLSLLDHLDKEQVDFDRNKPFKRKSVWASKAFKRIFLLLLLVAIITPAISFWMMNRNPLAVQLLEVSRGLLSTEISVPGRVVSKRKINVSARLGGQVTEVAVREGDTVTKGQLLVQMDDKEALSDVNRIQAQLLSVQETVAQTSKLQERLQKALDVGAVSRQRVEDAEADWKTASAKQSVVEEELKSAKMQLEKLKIKAPFDGMITAVTVQEGQWVAPSAPLLNIVDMTQRMAEISVDVSDSGNLSVGQTVILTSDAFPSQSWEEQITKISSEASREESANIIKVFASMDKSPAELRIGQQLDAQIRTAARSNALLIPFNVLFTHQGRPHVAIVENSKVRFVPVVLGIESASHVEVTEGLREGQQLIIPTGIPLKEGESVIVASSVAK